MLKKHFTKNSSLKSYIEIVHSCPQNGRCIPCICVFFEDKNNCQPFVFQIFGTVGVPNQWWCISMAAHIWKVLEIYMMGVSWQVMAMWSSSQSTIDWGYLVRSLFSFTPLIHKICDSFVLTCFVLLCFVSPIVLCLLTLFESNFLIFSMLYMFTNYWTKDS